MEKDSNESDTNPEGDPLIGTMIGRYIVQEKIGHGGMGSVYSILQPAIHKRLALKLLHKEYAERKEIVKRFFDEARAVNLIGHPNIVDITDFSHLPDGRPFIIMEFLDGKSLEEYLETNRTLAPMEVVTILKQLTSALDAAHAKKIVHRDLKPENIFLCTLPEGGFQLKVLDFGIAKLADRESDDTRATQTGVVLGTPTYMSPEQATGNSQQADHRTDIYATGIILYEMLTGSPPFSGQSFAELIMKHIQADVPDLCDIRDDLPSAWHTVVVTAMAKDPNDRYQSMQELFAAVELAAKASTEGDTPRDVEATAIAVVAPQPTPIHTKRSKSIAPFVISTVVLAVAAAVFFVGMRSGANDSAENNAAGPTLVNNTASADARAIASPTPKAISMDAAYPRALLSADAAPDTPRVDAGIPTPDADTGVTAIQQATRKQKGHGTLNVRSIPWAAVYLDGKRVGGTPFKRKLSVGRHRIVLHNDYLGKKKRYSFTIKSGDTHTINERW